MRKSATGQRCGSLGGQPAEGHRSADSDILCFNGMATLVPKRAVLHIPKNFADRLKYPCRDRNS